MTFNINKGNLAAEHAGGDTGLTAVRNADGSINKSKSQVDIRLDLDSTATVPTITTRHEIEHGVQADNNPDLVDKTLNTPNPTPESDAQRQIYENDARDFANQYYDLDPNSKNGLTQGQAEGKIRNLLPEPKPAPQPMPENKDPK